MKPAVRAADTGEIACIAALKIRKRQSNWGGCRTPSRTNRASAWCKSGQIGSAPLPVFCASNGSDRPTSAGTSRCPCPPLFSKRIDGHILKLAVRRPAHEQRRIRAGDALRGALLRMQADPEGSAAFRSQALALAELVDRVSGPRPRFPGRQRTDGNPFRLLAELLLVLR